MYKKNFLSFVVCSIILSGCASNTEQSSDDIAKTLDTDNSEALASLVDVSVEVRDELRLIAKMQEAKVLPSLTQEQVKQKQYQALIVPEGFNQMVEFGIQAPSTQAVKAIATMAGYTFKTYGKKVNSFQEPWVNIHTTKKPLIEFLRDAGMQTGTTARVEVFPDAKLIRYIYKSFDEIDSKVYEPNPEMEKNGYVILKGQYQGNK